MPPWIHDAGDESTRLAVVAGNSRRIWEPFVSWLDADPSRRSFDDPLDSYVEARIEFAVAEAGTSTRSWVGYSNRVRPEPLPMQRLAVASGLAHQSPAGLVIHERCGPWIALRALIIVDLPAPVALSKASGSTRSPCIGCSAPCVAAYKRARGLARLSTHRPPAPSEHPTPRDLSPASRLWLAARDACPVGVADRYGAAQILYHYDKNQSGLQLTVEIEA